MELQILDSIQEYLQSDAMDSAMTAVSSLGNAGLIWILWTAVLLFRKKTRKAGAAMALALVLELFACNLVIKPLAARLRPFSVREGVQLLIQTPTDYSFPSGHTGASFASAAALFFRKSRMWIPAAVLAALIGFSRLYLYVHYPTDVLGGALLGCAAGWIGSRLAEKKRK